MGFGGIGWKVGGTGKRALSTAEEVWAGGAINMDAHFPMYLLSLKK